MKHNIHTLLSRQLICVDCFTSVVPDKWGVTVTDITSNKAGVHDVIQQLLPHTDDIQTVHRWESTEAKDRLKKGFILCILGCKAVLFEMSIVPGPSLLAPVWYILHTNKELHQKEVVLMLYFNYIFWSILSW